jgi:hypothetical protein
MELKTEQLEDSASNQLQAGALGVRKLPFRARKFSRNACILDPYEDAGPAGKETARRCALGVSPSVFSTNAASAWSSRAPDCAEPLGFESCGVRFSDLRAAPHALCPFVGVSHSTFF